MATFTETVEIDVGPEDFEDDDLMEELRDRGYYVSEQSEFANIIYCWRRGDKKEALFLLEREVPELYGISKLI